jgi:hypothetical protein
MLVLEQQPWFQKKTYTRNANKKHAGFDHIVRPIVSTTHLRHQSGCKTFLLYKLRVYIIKLVS